MSTPQPDWSTAPAWAQWWAVDADGSAWWYAWEIVRHYTGWTRISRKPDVFAFDRQVDMPADYDWTNSLQQRPEVTA